jgi:hypothetical protein
MKTRADNSKLTKETQTQEGNIKRNSKHNNTTSNNRRAGISHDGTHTHAKTQAQQHQKLTTAIWERRAHPGCVEWVASV